MKDKIIVFVIGLLLGAIIATSGFLIYNKTMAKNSNQFQSSQNGQMGQPPTNGNMEEPPEKPDTNNSEEIPNKPENSNSNTNI